MLLELNHIIVLGSKGLINIGIDLLNQKKKLLLSLV